MAEFEDAATQDKIKTRRQPKLETLASYDGIVIMGAPEEKEAIEEDPEELQEDLQEEIKESKKGRMKSGKFWKKDFNTKSSTRDKLRPKDEWETRKKISEKTKALHDKCREIRENSIKEIVRVREQQKKNRELRNLNEWKSSKFQVISNSKKIMKMDKNTRAKLSKMPREIFDEWLHANDKE